MCSLSTQGTHPCVMFLPRICLYHRFYATHHQQWQPGVFGREVGMLEDLELMAGRMGREVDGVGMVGTVGREVDGGR